jgi:hydrogenase expression/formation protein HypC
MCLAIPGRVIEVTDADSHLASIEVSGVRRQVNIDLIREDGVNPGDWVLIHVGFALSKISPQEAQETLRSLALLGEAEAATEEVKGYRFGDDESASNDQPESARGS